MMQTDDRSLHGAPVVHPEDRSLKDLLTDLSGSLTTLFRKEIQLARAETSEKITQSIVAKRSSDATSQRERSGSAPHAVFMLPLRSTTNAAASVATSTPW